MINFGSFIPKNNNKEYITTEIQSNGDIIMTEYSNWAHLEPDFKNVKIIYTNGDIYEGSIKDGKKMYGELTFKTGFYDGEWKDDKRHGEGKSQVNDSYYEGKWKDDKRHGKGVLLGIYDGEWEDDKMHGKGKLFINNGVYKGDMKNGKRHGKGTFDSEECFYDGEWEDDKRHGKGKNIYFINTEDKNIFADKDTYLSSYKMYDGEWKDDNPCESDKFIHV